MSDPTEPVRELESTYIVQDRSNQDEMTRLEVQDKMLTTGMGGVLPELADPTLLRRVLDVGCGTGGWLLETARSYPSIETLFGVDISSKMMAYARAQAEAQQLAGQVQFQTMDALRILEFPPASFDLVNQRGATSWLRTWDWEKLLLEYQRVSRPGGIIRITEFGGAESNSPALTKLNAIGLEASYNSGRLFTASHDGVTRELVRLMTVHGISNVQTRLHTLVFQAGTLMGQYFSDDMAHLFHLAKPFYQKWTRVPDDYQEIYEQALKEMQQPDFVATWTFLTAWGTRPHGKIRSMRGLQ
jgi:ubiquinone/menaquinone biosynthesis C-methylase UbiE